MNEAIQFTHLTKLYDNGRGIDDLNLTVKQGEIFGFLGPNGAGKTTVMKLMTGLIQPTVGDVAIFGASVQQQLVQALSHVGCLIETAESFQYLTAYENLQLSASYYKH